MSEETTTNAPKSLGDLVPKMELRGTVKRIELFGAFVDIGVHQDGLVHLSQITNRFIKDPNEVLKVAQRVEVTVVEVDVNRKRISLSMKENEPRPKPAERKSDDRKPAQQNKPHFNSNKPKPTEETDMAIKLAALRSKFK